MSAIALFSNTSYFHNIVSYSENITYSTASSKNGSIGWQRLCAGMPFSSLFVAPRGTFPQPNKYCIAADLSISAGFKPTQLDLLNTRRTWIGAFKPDGVSNPMQNVEGLLQVSMFVANRALLTFYSPSIDGDEGYDKWRGRAIYSSPGRLVQKPVVSTAALIIISLLIGAQLIGLAYLAYYIYHVPTWTGRLDAMAIARVGASLAEKDILPPIGGVTKEHIEALKDEDGLVGIVETQEGSELRMRATSSNTSHTDISDDVELQHLKRPGKGTYMSVDGQASPRQLGLGAPGVIRSNTMAAGR
jgi:hypothetical protein